MAVDGEEIGLILTVELYETSDPCTECDGSGKIGGEG